MLGNTIMEQLKELDKVAYVRFASVYRSFEDIKEFGEEIARLGDRKVNYDKFSQQDHEYMQRALSLAKHAHYTTSPNPRVGCVIVSNNEIVGEGYHVKAGEGHAEVNAIETSRKLTKGATAYVTLEPCSHYGRTPPCAEGLIKAGIKHVIAAMVDPNPKVSGKGLEMLEAAGITTAIRFIRGQKLKIKCRALFS